MKHKVNKKSKTWWIFYPLKGFDITNIRDDINKPMFEDSTIISRRHISRIVNLLGNSKKSSADIEFILSKDISRQEFNSFIAVRRTGVLEQRKYESKLIKDATQRAYEIAALLSLVFLSRSRYGHTCGLVEQLHRQAQSISMFDFQYGEFSTQLSGQRSFADVNSKLKIADTRAELKKELFKKRNKGLTNAILNKRTNLSKSIRNAIVQSSIRLSDAIHSITLSAQLLGAVTSVEILISEQGDSYETTKRRLIALLGENYIIKYDVERILKSRHLYVHCGEEVQGDDISPKAIALALSCLLRYSESASLFRDKLTFIKYLDFIYNADMLSDNWNKKERLALDKIVKHNRKGHEFLFLKYI